MPVSFTALIMVLMLFAGVVKNNCFRAIYIFRLCWKMKIYL